MTQHCETRSGLFDRELLYFIAAVAVAVVLFAGRGWTAAEWVPAIVAFVMAEHLVSWRLHESKWIRTTLSLIFGAFVWLAVAEVGHAFGH